MADERGAARLEDRGALLLLLEHGLKATPDAANYEATPRVRR